MDSFRFTYKGRLPGLNEIIDKARYNKFASAAQKLQFMNDVAYQIPFQECANRHKYFIDPVNVFIKWYEPNSKRDPDNIMAGQKFILDALVGKGVLPDDSQKYIRSISHEFYVDKENPHIDIELRSVVG